MLEPQIKTDLLIFDLDGTLVDSKKDIANSTNHTMRTLGLPVLADEVIYSFVGNGVTPLIRQSVESALVSSGAGDTKFEEALAIFKQHYMEHLLDTTLPFEGIVEILQHFQGRKKFILTNKSQGFAEKVVRGLKLDAYFEGLFGGDTSFPKKPDPTVIHHLLKISQTSPDHALIIGDSKVDIQTGKRAGIRTCGVTYGFRPRAELEEAGCDYLIDHPSELAKIV